MTVLAITLILGMGFLQGHRACGITLLFDSKYLLQTGHLRKNRPIHVRFPECAVDRCDACHLKAWNRCATCRGPGWSFRQTTRKIGEIQKKGGRDLGGGWIGCSIAGRSGAVPYNYGSGQGWDRSCLRYHGDSGQKYVVILSPLGPPAASGWI